jgi:hypothetical protein
MSAADSPEPRARKNKNSNREGAHAPSRANPKCPERARCDFCGDVFWPPRWNCRTCHRCEARSCPDQSLLPWREYMVAVRAYHREQGKMRLRGHPLTKRSLPANLPQDASRRSSETNRTGPGTSGRARPKSASSKRQPKEDSNG